MGTLLGWLTMNEVRDLRRQQHLNSVQLSQERIDQINRAAVESLKRAAERLELFRPIDPVLSAWRDANPRARSPRWYREIEAFCAANTQRAHACVALFVQQAGEETSGARLLRIARSAVVMAGCNHERGTWSGSATTASGEYDDNLIFSCPDCGYKGA